ncbi:D-sedoheptulose 7-phosphate isomerase [Teredinibacter sp. KSP-S5-2]|uniref:D-sedoheptulose-7-phosphate isomerase n=1 Tax=Teredinibacter sp. KSP-S5-2 TaxID=3034506 RepID=UPI002934B23A|nr:D-sedoheptulose 7-phosphate isomerase [Teredinibacter sp. KSP-S5-2]WNO09555.1 D-sedoheptulose 7-phosphate isomerase [Teredinibacter sp. KSP-S5-2]
MSHLEYIEKIFKDSISVKESILASSEVKQSIDTVCQVLVDAYRAGNKMLIAGNGGSAGDSQHIAAELVVRFEKNRKGLPAIALTTDTSMLTAIGNDFGFDHLFSRQVEAQAKPGDVFIGISTSGNSKNIIEAINVAKAECVTTIGLCGAGGKIKDMVDHAICVPSDCTARIQESHIVIGHIICGVIEQKVFDSE